MLIFSFESSRFLPHSTIWSDLLSLQIVLCGRKREDKKRVPFSVLSPQELIDKKGTLLPSSFADKCNCSLMLHLFSTLRRKFHLRKSFHKSIFGILNTLDMDKNRLQNQSIAIW